MKKLIVSFAFVLIALTSYAQGGSEHLTFKEIPVKGKLYSTMFNQSFSADGAVCSLKEDKEGRFDLRINGVSHHSWFRRKKDEFMEALGLPTSRRSQNRGMKL